MHILMLKVLHKFIFVPFLAEEGNKHNLEYGKCLEINNNSEIQEYSNFLNKIFYKEIYVLFECYSYLWQLAEFQNSNCIVSNVFHAFYTKSHHKVITNTN